MAHARASGGGAWRCGGGYSYPQSSPAASPFKLRDNLHRSPASLFHSPTSSPASRSPSVSWLAGRERDRLFSSFVRNALGSCIDYAPVASLPLGVPAAAGVDAAELAFELDENLPEAEPSCEPYAHELLAGAQARHRIFRDELVVKAFFEAERAHRGQVNFGSSRRCSKLDWRFCAAVKPCGFCFAYVIRSGLVVIHTCSIVWKLQCIWPKSAQTRPSCLLAFSMTQLMTRSWTMMISSGCLALV